MICNSCPRKCNVERSSKTGFCGVGERFKIARAALHFWEEPCISGKNGSGTIFFSGCNLRCVYCQNRKISAECFGKEVSDERFIEIMKELVERGANNINLVSPSHYAFRIAEVLNEYKPQIPVVYNSSGFDSVEALKMLDGLVDVYLPDYKYISHERAEKYSKAKAYPDIVTAAISEMKSQQPEEVFDENGMIQKGVMIRHLVLPKNTNQSLSVLDSIYERFGKETYISLMSQYTPCGNLEGFPELQRKITEREYEKAVSYAFDLGFENVFVQDIDSATEDFIPSFELEGV